MSEENIIKGRWWKIKTSAEFKTIIASYDTFKEWVQDPTGYFLIKIDRPNKKLKAGFVTNTHELQCEIEGNNAEEIYNTIIKQKLVSTLQHSAYLGLELQKAEHAMHLGWTYIQDRPLDYFNAHKEP